MKVPIFKLKFEKTFQKKFFTGCRKIFRSGILTNGAYVKKFEKKFAKFCGTKHALTVSSGTGALEIVLRALNIQGKKVILPINTFIATAAAIKNAGGEILPLDIEKETLSLSPSALKKTLTKEENIGAVIIVHVGGIISRHIKTIVKLCKKHDVPLIEDAAHAHGSSMQGKRAGSFGVVGCFSFYPTKVMTTGEGGMITTNNKDFYELIYSIRQFGMSKENKDLHIRPGSNFKMTEFQALLGLLELERVNKRVARRQKLAQVYQEQLKNTSWQPITPSPGGKSSYYKQIVLSPISPEKATRLCQKRGIELTGTIYCYPLHQQPVFKKELKRQKFPVADWFCQNHICPPLYPELSKQDILYICSTLKKLKS